MSLGGNRRRDSHGEDIEQEETYYAPMADLLAGILFIILLLLMSFAIIHYPDPDSAPISSLAPQPRSLTAPRLEPEVDARARQLEALDRERTRLLDAISADLVARGVPARVDPGASRIVIEDGALFKAGTPDLSFSGELNAKEIGIVLAQHVRCVDNSCPSGEVGRVNGVFIDVAAAAGGSALSGKLDARTFAAARALALFHTMVRGDASLLALRNGGGGELIRIGGVERPESAVLLGIAMDLKR